MAALMVGALCVDNAVQPSDVAKPVLKPETATSTVESGTSASLAASRVIVAVAAVTRPASGSVSAREPDVSNISSRLPCPPPATQLENRSTGVSSGSSASAVVGVTTPASAVRAPSRTAPRAARGPLIATVPGPRRSR